jgi:asparagine synthase (glutamine-hydrolysing)
MLSAAVAGLLPPTVANRGTKGTFDADHYRGIRANRADLLPLADGHLAGAGLVAPTALRTMLTQTAAGLQVALAGLESVLAAEVWLRAVNAAPPIAWTTVAAPATEPV